MKLIGAGYPRTGTLSTKIALEQIGFGPCYHFYTLFERPQHVDVWLEAANGGLPDWKALLADFQAAIDWPVSLFYKQLTREYPDAKVLLTTRDPEAWYNSILNTVYFASHLPVPEGSVFHKTENFINILGWQGHFQGRFEDKAFAISMFERHHQEVKDSGPANRLLIWDVKEGWEPLCAFLGVPVPDMPFPHVNDTKEFLARLPDIPNRP